MLSEKMEKLVMETIKVMHKCVFSELDHPDNPHISDSDRRMILAYQRAYHEIDSHYEHIKEWDRQREEWRKAKEYRERISDTALLVPDSD